MRSRISSKLVFAELQEIPRSRVHEVIEPAHCFLRFFFGDILAIATSGWFFDKTLLFLSYVLDGGVRLYLLRHNVGAPALFFRT